MCRESLEEQMEFVRHYLRALGSSIDDRFERLMSALPPAPSLGTGPAHVTEGIELTFQPCRGPFSREARWAAATEAPARGPLRFCSADGRYVLKDVSTPAAPRPSFCLIAGKDSKVEGVELVIDGERRVTGSGGMLDAGEAGLELTRDSRITIRTNRPA